MSETVENRRARLIRRILLDLSLLTAIGFVLAIIGPFGSFEIPFAVRLVSWLSLAYIGYAFYGPIDSFAVRYGPRLDLPMWWLRIAACLVATIPMAAVVWVVGYLPGPIPLPSVQQAVIHYGYVLVIGALITSTFYILGRRTRFGEEPALFEPSANPESPAQTEPAKAKFLDRIPSHLGERLIALEMEDHYVRVHTDQGSDLVLMRMRDAVAELGGIEGAQVHRSWWVARDAVTGSRKDGRNVRLVLEGDLEAPVSRNNVGKLKERGWF